MLRERQARLGHSPTGVANRGCVYWRGRGSTVAPGARPPTQGDSLGGERCSTVSTFEFNEDGFKRPAKAAGQAKVEEMKQQMDQSARQYQGRPVAVIKSALRRACERDGRTIADPELTEYAAYISEGTPIKFRA